MRAKILLVDDDAMILSGLKRQLRKQFDFYHICVVVQKKR